MDDQMLYNNARDPWETVCVCVCECTCVCLGLGWVRLTGGNMRE